MHLSQHKYVIESLDAIGMMDTKPIKIYVLVSKCFRKFDGVPLTNPSEYIKIVGSLQYLTLTRLRYLYLCE